MGCLPSKPSTYSPQKGLEKLNAQNGYVKGAGPEQGAAGYRKAATREPGKEGKRQLESNKVDGSFSGGGKDLQKKANRKIGGDVLVDGWPKWLIDNVDKDVLAGLVPKTADSYDKIAKIGHGTYSNVYKAIDRDSGKIVALKKVRFDTSQPESVRFMAREIRILQHLDHPNVIKLEGIATSRMQYSLYLVFEYMQADLTKIISRTGQRLTESQVKCYMKQLLSGLAHCHERGILHRDIKASNLLIDDDGRLKIADFGLANFFNPAEKRPMTSRVVTLWYRAPELLLGSTDYGVGVDLWSAGCLLAEMFLGRPFMPGKTEVEQLHKIFKLCGSPSEDFWKKMKLPASFRPPQHYQPSYREIFKDFPASSFGLLSNLLALDPAYRGTAKFALQNEFFISGSLASNLSDLPILRNEEPCPSQTKSVKKRKKLNGHEVFQPKPEVKERKDMVTVRAKLESESFREEDGSDISIQFTATSISVNSSIQNLHTSPSPVRRCIHESSSSRTEGHPNALKNIQNYTLLQASITDIIDPREGGNNWVRLQRSLSTLDSRYLDPEKISKLFGLENKD